MISKSIQIDNTIINENSNTYIVAEMSANHLMDFNRGKEIIKYVKEAGADAIKLQTYTPDTITMNYNFKTDKNSLWKGDTLYELYKKAYTPWEWQEDFKNYANELGISCFSSPFDFTSVDFLESIDVPAYKIASYEITDIPLIQRVAKTKKPIIISTGIATLEDISLAIKTCLNEDNKNIIILKCTSAYPCPFEHMNIKAINFLRDTFNCIVGLSDHTLGSEVALGAVALGAKVIEKHVTLKRCDGGVDSEFSMEINEFKEMVTQIKNLEKSLGKNEYTLTNKQINERKFARSLYVTEDMKKGEKITLKNVRSIRPNDGLHPKYLKSVLNKSINIDLKKGTPFKLSYINEEI